MKIIPISGVIANFQFEGESNVTPDALRKSLDEANGEDILVTINSPGGGVFAGLEMFSLLKNYSGNVETRIVSLAASMGSVLALAGNKKSAEDTALYFVHNAQGGQWGDYRALAKESKFLEDISSLMANLYSKYTTLSLKEARDYMDEDSQFFGKDLESLGFEIVESENNVDQSTARINAKMQFNKLRDKAQHENYIDDFEKVASMDFSKFGINNNIKKAQTPADSAGKNIMEVQTMSLMKFMQENPAAKQEFDNLVKEKTTAGINENSEKMQKNIDEISNFLDPTSKFSNAIKGLAVKCLKNEITIETFRASIAVIEAMEEQKKSDAAQEENETIGETPGEQAPVVFHDGTINNDLDYQAEIARTKAMIGLEVK